MHRKFAGLMLLMMAMTAQQINAQKTVSEFQFGTHITYPGISGKNNYKPAWSSNYFLGFVSKRNINKGNRLHYGVIFNFINYRINEKNSTQTLFSTINSFSFPVQSEFVLIRKFSLLLGTEPKWSVNAIEFNSTTGVTRKMPFISQGNGYRELNLGFRAGLNYQRQFLNYFLQISADAFPYKVSGSTAFFDRKIIFGFTLFPLNIKK